MDVSPEAQPKLELALLGELRVLSDGKPVTLPASRKTRALLAYLVRTNRTHRRERLCTMFWDIPDDPKAALRWSLSKLRRVLDAPEAIRIIADRERVRFATNGAVLDIAEIQAALDETQHPLSIERLEQMARRLDHVFLDGLDGVGDDGFQSWLEAERVDAWAARVEVLRRLVGHPETSSMAAGKWLRFWRDIDREGAEAHMQAACAAGAPALVASGTKFAMGGAAPTVEPPPLDLQVAGARDGLMRIDAIYPPEPQRIGFCAVQDGTKIAYATVGSGPPILKAANWLNHLELDWASPIWGRSFNELARHRTLIRYDERGCGLSDWDVKDLNFEAFVEDLASVVDKLGLERVPLIGISQGCAVSIEYAVRHPERVSGLILISGYAAGWRHSASPEEQVRREAVRRLTEVGWGTDNPAYRHIFSLTFMPDAREDVLSWFDEFQRQTTSPRNAARFQDAFGDIDVRRSLAAVSVPTIVLHSKYDQRISLSQGLELAREIPNALFVPLESRNHILVEDEPAWDVCFGAIKAFLSEHGI